MVKPTTRGVSTPLSWAHLGALLANSDDLTQGEFFRSFAREVDSWETHQQKETQMLLIGDQLNDKEKELIVTIGLK